MTPDPELVAEVAGKLTKAQRVALSRANGWPVVYADNTSQPLLNRLGRLRLTHPPTSRLTPLGLAVRDYLEGEKA